MDDLGEDDHALVGGLHHLDEATQLVRLEVGVADVEDDLERDQLARVDARVAEVDAVGGEARGQHRLDARHELLVVDEIGDLAGHVREGHAVRLDLGDQEVALRQLSLDRRGVDVQVRHDEREVLRVGVVAELHGVALRGELVEAVTQVRRHDDVALGARERLDRVVLGTEGQSEQRLEERRNELSHGRGLLSGVNVCPHLCAALRTDCP